MEGHIYRLGEYKIIETDTGYFRWETHSGLGEFQEGRCFRKGMILFIGPVEGKGDGLLKLEFIDQLKRFPEWQKTKYFCPALTLNECKIINQVWGKKKKRLLNKKSIKPNPIRTSPQSNHLHKRVFSKPDRIFSTNRLEALKSLPKLTTGYKNCFSFPRFKVKKPDILKSIVLFRGIVFKKWVAFSACFILLTGLCFLFIFLDHKENHYEKSHYKKGNYNSSNRRGH